jgi:peptide alpha-N-acetyltransferase
LLFATVFTYRYFLHRFPQLCILAVADDTNEPIGCVVGKIDVEEEPDDGAFQQDTPSQRADVSKDQLPNAPTTGYIGMLAVTESYRRQGIGQVLVQRILRRMKEAQCSSATLETEVTNTTAQKLYQDRFGFIREELLVRYYLNWNDAYRLRLWF